MFKFLRKKVGPKPRIPKGLKAVAPPKDPELRRLMEGPDIGTSGGCCTVQRQPVPK